MTITIICQDTLGTGHTHKSLNEEKTHIRHLERTKPLGVSSAGGAFHVSRFTFHVSRSAGGASVGSQSRRRGGLPGVLRLVRAGDDRGEDARPTALCGGEGNV